MRKPDPVIITVRAGSGEIGGFVSGSAADGYQTDPCPACAPQRTVTLVVPDGYATGEEFSKDCGFELAESPLARLAATLAREVKASFEMFEPLARREMGNTNYQCIVDAADAVLAAIAPAVEAHG